MYVCLTLKKKIVILYILRLQVQPVNPSSNRNLVCPISSIDPVGASCVCMQMRRHELCCSGDETCVAPEMTLKACVSDQIVKNLWLYILHIDKSSQPVICNCKDLVGASCVCIYMRRHELCCSDINAARVMVNSNMMWTNNNTGRYAV